VTAQKIASGYCEGRNAELMRQSEYSPFILRVERPDGVHWLEHRDRQVLERYFAMQHGAKLDWK